MQIERLLYKKRSNILITSTLILYLIFFGKVISHKPVKLNQDQYSYIQSEDLIQKDELEVFDSEDGETLIKNREYKYSLLYPKGWQDFIRYPTYNSPFEHVFQVEKLESNYNNHFSYVSIKIILWTDNDIFRDTHRKLNIYTYFDKIYVATPQSNILSHEIKINNLFVDGVNAVKTVSEVPRDAQLEPSYSEHIYILRDSYLYEIRAFGTGIKDIDNIRDSFNKIVQSFHFL